MVLFAQKIYQLLKSVHMDEKQKELLEAAAKYMTLLNIAVISSLINGMIAVAYQGVINVLNKDDDKNLLVLSTMISNILTIMDNTINIVCLSLQYSFNKRYYERLCNCFAHCCMDWIAK